VLPDGTTFIVGRTSLDSGERFDEAFAVWKRNADGTPDTTFNGEGSRAAIPIWGYRESAEGLAVQPDGKIVVAGLAWDPICGYLCEDRTAIVRLNPDGTLDRSFNGDGIIAIVINYVDGGILSAASGTEVSFDPVDVKILPDGTIQVAASVQVHPDGTLKGVVDNYFGHFAARETPLPHVQGSWYAAPPESEAGWGITFSQQGEIVFAGWFTYDAGGRAWWLSMTAVRTGEGIYRGTIIETRGPAFHTQPFDPALVTRKAVGEGTLTFIDRNTGKFAYTIEGVSQTKTITRQVFGPLPACSYGTLRDPANATNFQDMWWAAPAGSESGWGISLADQGDVIFAVWFTYDFDSRPLWLSGTARKTSPGAYAGTLYRTAGPPYNATPWDRKAVTLSEVGSYTLTFVNGNAGTFRYQLFSGDLLVIDQSKPITRLVFRNPGTTCR
jgi:uncharacterized delta-60 repeat protein